MVAPLSDYCSFCWGSVLQKCNSPKSNFIDKSSPYPAGTIFVDFWLGLLHHHKQQISIIAHILLI